jgi:hypothetical protein
MLIYITVMLSDVKVMCVAFSYIIELLLFVTGTLTS